MTYAINDLLGRAIRPAGTAGHAIDADSAAASMVEAVEEVTRTRYFFSADGNDANDGLSEATPKRTMAAARAAVGANREISFRRGDVWRTGQGLPVVAADGAAVTAWGTGARPRLTAFTEIYTSGWTSAGNGRWTRPGPAIGWLFDAASPLDHPYAKVASAAEVEAGARSFWHDGALLHVNANGISPNTLQIEATPATTPQASTIGIRDSGLVLVRELRLEGAGLSGNGLNQSYGVIASNFGDRLAVIDDCEAYYNPRHNLGQAQVTAAGGRLLARDCRLGYVEEDIGTLWISYSPSGDNESIIGDCEMPFGSLKKPGTSEDPTARAVYAHTDGTAVVGRQIALRCGIPAGAERPPRSFGYAGNVGLPGSPAAAVASQTGCYYLGAGDGGDTFVAGNVRHRCRFDLRPKGQYTGLAVSNAPQTGGWFLASALRIDVSGVIANGTSLSLRRFGIYKINSEGNKPRIHNSHIHWVGGGNPSVDCFLDADALFVNNSADAEMTNTVVTAEGFDGARRAYLGLNNDPAKCHHNAFRGIDRTGGGTYGRCDAHAASLDLALLPPWPAPPPGIGGQRLSAGQATAVVGEDLEGTRWLFPPSIGPIEFDDRPLIEPPVDVQAAIAAALDAERLRAALDSAPASLG